MIGLGETATFTITVENTGEVALVDVDVTDTRTPTCDALDLGPLAVGDSISYSCTSSPVLAAFVNTVDVAATDGNGNIVTSTDSADVLVDPPAFTVTKTPTTQDVPLGGTATFTITITNTSLSTLTDVTVTDLATPACDTTIATLPGTAAAPANVVAYTCDATALTADFTNTVSVAARDLAGNDLAPRTDSAVVDVLLPGVSITKTPGYQMVDFAGTAVFTITVRNTGEIDLVGVDVTDAATPACDRTGLTARRRRLPDLDVHADGHRRRLHQLGHGRRRRRVRQQRHRHGDRRRRGGAGR